MVWESVFLLVMDTRIMKCVFGKDAAEIGRRPRQLQPVSAKLLRKDSSQCMKTGKSWSYATACKASSVYVSRLMLDCFEKTCNALSADEFCARE